MKSYIQLTLLCLCAFGIGVQSLVAPPTTTAVNGNAVVPPATPAPLPTLTQDFEELYTLIQFKPINQLVVRYLLNDAQFQALVRVLNSQQAFILRLRIRSQPEIIAFTRWVNAQLLLSGGPLELEEGEQTISLINPLPYWSATVSGLQGFLNELQLYYPEYIIRANIEAKILQNGIFAQFWARLQALQPVYERLLALPEAQTIIARLQLAGIDTNLLDQFIRAQLGWKAAASTTAAPVTTALPDSPTIVPSEEPGVPVEPVVPVA